jgi:histidine triad (HIT) family protein
MPDDCLFCGIVAGTIASTPVEETETTFAFRDIKPEAPVHILVVPRAHLSGLDALDAAHGDLLTDIFAAIRRIADREGIAESGYRVVANTGAEAGQTVFHLHFHVLGGRPLRWPPG